LFNGHQYGPEGVRTGVCRTKRSRLDVEPVDLEPFMISRIASFVACLLAFVALPTQAPNAGNLAAAEGTHALESALQGAKAGGQAGKPGSASTAFTTLPSFGNGSEALAVNASGTVVVGTAWDRSDLLHAVRWTLQNGQWMISSMPWPPGASSAAARGVNNAGDAAGSSFPASTSRALLWPAAGTFSVLGCTTDTRGQHETVYAISADARVVAGYGGGGAAVWQPGSCRTNLPALFAGGSTSGALAVNGPGTLVGGAARESAGISVPVRWVFEAGAWHAQQLDGRPGIVTGSNAIGDLAGYVYVAAGAPSLTVPCNVAAGCQRAVIWPDGGSVFTLGTLGGADSWARDINASGDVVGGSTSPQVGNTGFIWFAHSQRMVQLPFKGRWAAANALSDVRVDGTRLVVGMSSTADAVVWVVANP
jgi:uncharacterized membrane protein